MLTPVNRGGSVLAGDPAQQGPKFRADLRKPQGLNANTPLGHDNDIGVQGDFVLVEPEKLTH